jgi:hypothetical protein
MLRDLVYFFPVKMMTLCTGRLALRLVFPIVGPALSPSPSVIANNATQDRTYIRFSSPLLGTYRVTGAKPDW